MKPDLHRNLGAAWWALSALLLLSCGHSEESLRQRVTGFWAAQSERDRVRAQEFVAPASRNAFLRHRERIYRSPHIQEIHEDDDGEARVRIAYEGYVEELRRFENLEETQLWKKIDGTWFLEVDPPEKQLADAIKGVYGTPLARLRGTDADGQVQVSPEVRIPFFNRAQLGTLTIRNGTDQPLQVSRLELDETLFEVVEKPGEIPPLQKRRVKIKYLGNDELKNQKSPVTLEIEQGGELRQHRTEIVYNYISPGLRGILGLTEEQAAQLNRSDSPLPHLEVETPEDQAAELEKLREQLNIQR